MNNADEEDKFNRISQSISIHRTHLINIINGTYDKLQIVYCLEDLLKSNGELIAPYLKENNFKNVLDIYSKCSKMTVSQLKSHSCIESRMKVRKSLTLEEKLDIQYSHMLAILHHNPNIMRIVRATIQSKPFSNIEFLIRMQEFCQHIVELFYTTAEEEKAYNHKIGQAWVNNEKYKVRNLEMETIRQNKLFELSFKIAEKNKIIARYNKEIENLKANCLQDLHKIIDTSVSYPCIPEIWKNTIENFDNVSNCYKSAMKETNK